MSLSKKYKVYTQQGFTLVEVIVVVAVLAIVTALAVPSLDGFIAKAQEKQYKQEAQNAYETVQTLFALEQAGERDASLLTNNPPGKYIDLTKSSKLSDTGTSKYLQLSGRNPKITELSFDTSSNSIRTLTVTSSDGKADLTYDSQNSEKYTIAIR